jgi:hypothetical protein
VDTNITKIALDTHKKQHTVAWVNYQTGETDVFTVLNTNKDITKMVKKLRKKTGSQHPPVAKITEFLVKLDKLPGIAIRPDEVSLYAGVLGGCAELSVT